MIYAIWGRIVYLFIYRLGFDLGLFVLSYLIQNFVTLPSDLSLTVNPHKSFAQ